MGKGRDFKAKVHVVLGRWYESKSIMPRGPTIIMPREEGWYAAYNGLQASFCGLLVAFSGIKGAGSLLPHNRFLVSILGVGDARLSRQRKARRGAGGGERQAPPQLPCQLPGGDENRNH